MNSKWSNLIATAERLVGGPAPFINLDLLMTSEAGFLAARAKRLASTTDHPFFDSVRAYLHGKSAKYPFLPPVSKARQCPTFSTSRAPGGLVTLLVGQCGAGASAGCVKLCGAHRRVAEIFETANLAVSIHKSLINLNQISHRHPISQRLSASCDTDSGVVKAIEAGNKVATLAGDMLFSSVSKSLAAFHNSKVVDVVSEAMSNMLEAEFSPLALRFHYGSEATSRSSTVPDGETPAALPDQATVQWLDYVGLARGSLLGACCQSTMLLSHATETAAMDSSSSDSGPESVSKIAYQLGHRWALLVRLLDERDYARRFHLDSGNSTSDCGPRDPVPAYPDVPNYTENGLPEPTLVDALSGDSSASPDASDRLCVVRQEPDAVWRQYNSVGHRLVDELRDSLYTFGRVTTRLGSTEKTSSSALCLLTNMVDELAQELDGQRPSLA